MAAFIGSPFCSQMGSGLRLCLAVARGLFCACTLVLLCAVDGIAQGSVWQWGGVVEGAVGMPSVEFTELPGVVSCRLESEPLSADGGWGIGIAGELSRRVARSPLEIAARLGLRLAQDRFADEERIGEVTDAEGVRHDAVVEYRTLVERVELRLEPSVRWYPTSVVSVAAGALVALPLATSYEQTERLVAPERAVYLEGGTERALGEGSIDGSPWLGLTVGVGADIVAGGVIVRPELSGLLALSSPLSDIDWKPHELRLGVAVLFGDRGESTPITPGGGREWGNGGMGEWGNGGMGETGETGETGRKRERLSGCGGQALVRCCVRCALGGRIPNR